MPAGPVQAGLVQAGLAQDVSQLKRRVKAKSKEAEIHHFAPRYAERGEQQHFAVDASFPKLQSVHCVRLVVLSDPKVMFSLRVIHPAEENEVQNIPSVAGLAETMHCGEARAKLADFLVEMRSPRGVLEVIAIAAASELPEARSVMPKRQTGAFRPLAEVGPPPQFTALAERLAALQRSAQLLGESDADLVQLRTKAQGQGEHELDLKPGCYRIDGLAPALPKEHPLMLDVDLELSRLRDNKPLASDRSEAADARIEFCTATPERAVLRYGHLPPSVPLLALITRWEFPVDTRAHWSSQTMNQLALLWHQHRLPKRSFLNDGFQREWIGVSGQTRLSLPAAAGQCYQAYAVAETGEAAGLSLTAEQGRLLAAHQALGGAPIQIGFCARRSGAIRLKLIAYGKSLVWRVVAYRTGSLWGPALAPTSEPTLQGQAGIQITPGEPTKPKQTKGKSEHE